VIRVQRSRCSLGVYIVVHKTLKEKYESPSSEAQSGLSFFSAACLSAALNKDEPTADEALTFINNVYQKEIDALEKIRMEAEEKLLRLVKKKEHAMTWHKHKVSLVNQYRQEQSRLYFDTMFDDARRTFEAAYNAQRAHATVNQAFPHGVPSCATALRSFAAMCWWFDNAAVFNKGENPEH
jgi:hypothetical protein